jgi:hypothetical protein
MKVEVEVSKRRGGGERGSAQSGIFIPVERIFVDGRSVIGARRSFGFCCGALDEGYSLKK